MRQPVLLLVSLAVAAALVQRVHAGPAEVDIEAPGPLGPLRGTLLGPTAASAPLVLIVPGSGPTDRDGNNGPAGLRAASYRLLAEGLAARGVASVRIDKRGLYGSAAAVADPNAVTIGAYAQDVRLWVETLRKRASAPCVWIAGHSEGGLVALVAARGGVGVCGLVLIAAAGRPLGEVLREQLRANPANRPLLDPALAAIDALEAGRHVDTAALHPALRPLFRPAVQDYLIDVFSVDPARLIADVDKPVLILQGQRDLQVSVADAERLQRAAPGARLVLLPDANHVLKSAPADDREANLATYRDPARPLAAGVVDAIVDFIETSGARR